MTSAYLLPDLRRDEGLRLDAYPDPLSGGDPWTIGYGHTGPEVRQGLVWTQAQAEAALEADVANATQGLDTSLPWWRNLDDLRQDCLANMAFNMGVATLLTFNTFLGYMQAQNFAAAAADLAHTAWAGQVGARATRIMAEISTDVHQD
jgi:lysozyme